MGVLAKSPGKHGRAAVLAVFALLVLSAPAGAQQRAAPESAVAMKQSFAPVVKRAAPAVVNVYVRHRVEQMVSPFFNDPVFGRLFGERFGVPRERIQNSLGSGVLVAPEGVVVTNNHVIQGSGDTEITVALSDGREFPAKVILKDEQTDLAVLRLDAGGVKFTSIEFSDSDGLEVGDLVLAIGDPFGVGQTVTSGIVSALARTQVGISDYQFFIQTDAAINPGNSGGALVDVNGNLMGINTAIYSRSGGSMGIGFAIPVSTAKQVLEDIVRDGKVTRGWIGVEPSDLSPELAETFGVKADKGVIITGVLQAGPAAKAGIRPGDVITGVGPKKIDNVQELLTAVAGLKPGSAARFALQRGGDKMELDVTSGLRPKTPIRRAPAAPETE